VWSVDIDGTDITSLCQTITWNPKLSRPASLVVRVPGHLVSVTNGVSEMHLTNGSLLFSGRCWFPEDSGDPDATYTSITAYDHLIYLNKRMAKTPIDYPAAVPDQITDPDHPPGPCNLADPSLVVQQEGTAPAIMAAFIKATNDCDSLAPGGGPMPLTVGSVSGSGPDMSGVPAEWPSSIQDMADMLLSSGWLDMVVNPGVGSSTVDLITPPLQGGGIRDLTGSVSLDYATGGFNSQAATKTSDMDTVTNALWYLLGPRVHWWAQDISHWRGSITPTAANAGGDGEGGEPGTPWPPALVAKWMGSRATYGYMQEIQIHDQKEDEQTTARPLYEEMYANEALLRAEPRKFISIKPERQSGGGVSFLPGDLISVNAGAVLGGGFSGSVLVYEYEITVDADGVAEYTQLLASPDGNG
jgi:hypothetical protein